MATLPAGYSLQTIGDEILIQGPFDDDLNKRVRRLDGYWDGISHQNRRCFVVPLAKAASLDRILKNWLKARPNRQEKIDEAEFDRWLGYVQERSATGYYGSGVERCQHLLARYDWPERREQLDAAVAVALANAAKIKAERDARYAQEKAERDADRAAARLERDEKRQQRRANRHLFLWSESTPANTPIRLHGRVVVIESWGKRFRLPHEDEDIYGHLMHHGGEYVAYGYYRDATVAEIAQLEEQEATALAERNRRRDAAIERQALAALIQKGEFPTGGGLDILEGPRYCNTSNIYGGGSAFVVTTHWIWYEHGNSADGDDWGRNNVSGSMAWRIPIDLTIVARIEALHALGYHESERLIWSHATDHVDY